MKTKYILTILVLLLIESVYSQGLDKFLSKPIYNNALVGISVVDVDTEETIFEHNSQYNLTPASVLKLVTTAAAFEILGPDFSFTTKVAMNGTIVDGVLNGDLIIIGGGDPTLGSKYFKNQAVVANFMSYWIQLLRNNHIEQINGDLVIDASIFSDSDVPSTWIWEDLGNYFGAAAKGVSIYDNTFEIEFKTGWNNGDSTKIVRMEPLQPNLSIRNEVLSSNDPRDRAFVFGDPQSNFRTIKGTLPKQKESYTIKASIPNPAAVFANDFIEVMNDSMILFSGDIRYSFQEKYVEVDSILFHWISPTLTDVVTQTNCESINLFAETIGKYLGHYVLQNGSTEAGSEVISNFWRTKIDAFNGMHLADGSGLSRVNSISAETLTQILVYMATKSAYNDAFITSLPITGVEGTQKYYFQQSVLYEKARVKSGSMNRIRSFAGYLTTKSGRNIAFTIMVNNFEISSMKMANELEEMIEDIYETY